MEKLNIGAVKFYNSGMVQVVVSKCSIMEINFENCVSDIFDYCFFLTKKLFFFLSIYFQPKKEL